VIKAFPQLLKVFYNEDVVSDQAIIYWAQKGAKPQGKGHFLKATEALVKVCHSRFGLGWVSIDAAQFLSEQESDEE
jgi:hypothetical protein